MKPTRARPVDEWAQLVADCRTVDNAYRTILDQIQIEHREPCEAERSTLRDLRAMADRLVERAKR